MLAWYGHLIPNETSTIWNRSNVGLRDSFLVGIIRSTSALVNINLLPLQYHREINDVVYFFKCFKNVYKLNIFDYVLFRSCIKPLRNLDNLTLDVPFSRTDVFKNSFFVRICRLWNELLLSIRELNTLSVFCENLMAFYHDKFNVDVFKFYTVLYQIFSPFIIILFISVHVACLS